MTIPQVGSLRIKKAQEAFNKKVEEMLADPTEAIFCYTRLQRERIAGLIFSISAIFSSASGAVLYNNQIWFMYYTQAVTLGFGVFVIVSLTRIRADRRLIGEYNRRKKENKAKSRAASAEIVDSP